MKSLSAPIFAVALATALFSIPVTALEFEPRLSSGRNALANGDYLAARNAFAAVVAEFPDFEKAHAALALAIILGNEQEPQSRSFIERWLPAGASLDPFDWYYDLPALDVEDLPPDGNLEEFAVFLRNVTLPNVDAALSHLSQVQSGDFRMILRSEYFGDSPGGELVIVDKTDIDLIRAALLAYSAVMRWGLLSNQIGISVEVLRQLVEGEGTTLQQFLEDHPSIGSLQDVSERQRAGNDLRTAIEVYSASALQFRRPERRFENLFFLESWELEDEAEFRSVLLDIHAALNGPVTIAALSERAPVADRIDLRPLFGGLDLRAALPNTRGDRFVVASLPDATFSGLLPLATTEDWTEFLARKRLLWIEPVPLQGDWPWLRQLAWTTSDYGSWWIDDSSKARSWGIVRQEASWIETTLRGPGFLGFDWGMVGNRDYSSIDFVQNGVRRETLLKSPWDNLPSEQFGRKQRVGPTSTSVRWEYFVDDWSGWSPADGWLDKVEFDSQHAFPITPSADATRIEIRGMSADGTVLVGTVHKGSPTNTHPVYEMGDGVLKQFDPFAISSLAHEWFATASDILPGGRRAVGRIRNWDGYPHPVVWNFADWVQEIRLPTNAVPAVGMAVSIGGLRGEIIVGRIWSGDRWEAAIWRENRRKDRWEAWHLELPGSVLEFESDAWLYSISGEGRVAVGWAERITEITNEEGEPMGAVAEAVPTFWTEETGLKQLPLPEFKGELKYAQAEYISKNGGIISGSYWDRLADGESERGTVLWRADGKGGWIVEKLPVPDFVDSAGNSPLVRVTEDGQMVCTTGSYVDDNEERHFIQLIWTRAEGWQPARDYLVGHGFIGPEDTFDGVFMGPDGHTFAVMKNGAEDMPPAASIVHHPNPLAHGSTRIGGSWHRQDWFGAFALFGQWIYHIDQGWHYFHPHPGSGHFFYHSSRDAWAWTSSDLYPWIYWFGEAPGWAYGGGR